MGSIQQQPVLIPISCNDESDIPEWAMIEVNGEFLPPNDIPEISYDGENATATTEALVAIGKGDIELGAVYFRDPKSPVLIVGTHELQGVIQELAAPFVCLQPAESSSETSAYTVTGVVRRKLLFNQYPKTILH